jgi:hypothetical protein
MAPAPTGFSVHYYPVEARVCPAGVQVTLEIDPGFEISGVEYELPNSREPVRFTRLAPYKIEFRAEKPAISPPKEEAVDLTRRMTGWAGYYGGGNMYVSGTAVIEYFHATFRCGERPPVEVRLTRQQHGRVSDYTTLILLEDPDQASGLRAIARYYGAQP